MHHCLTVEEILSNIFNYIYWEFYKLYELDSDDLPPLNCLNTRGLANLAKTCKTFYEPAITILWSYQTSLIPLVRCLPSDAYVEKQQHESLSVLELSRDLLPSDFNRIKFHAQKVKSLETIYYYRAHDCKLSPSIVALLLLRKPESEPLLPNLHHLGLNESLFAGAAVIPRLVVGSCLRSVRIWLEDTCTGSSWDNIQTILSPYASVLKSFTLCRGNYFYDEFNSSSSMNMIRLYSNFRNIVHFTNRLVKLDDHALIHISTLPMLQKLDLSFHDINCSSVPELALNQLTELTLVTADLDRATHFLSSASFKALRIICIEREWMYGHDKRWSFRTFSKALRLFLRNCPLTSITLRVPDQCHEMGVAAMSLKQTDIQSLFIFPHISTFEVDICSTILLDDSLLMKMSGAWPKLQRLQLQDEERYDGLQCPKFTPAGILSFARSCPDLERLTLCFNAEEIPNFASYDALSPTPSNLKYLDVCRSPILDAEHVSQYLTLAFPSLQQLHIYWTYPQDCDEQRRWSAKWQQVESELIQVLYSRLYH